jgi:hypothetical protein
MPPAAIAVCFSSVRARSLHLWKATLAQRIFQLSMTAYAYFQGVHTHDKWDHA